MMANNMDNRISALERQISQHLGECAMRHADIIRRQEEARVQRETLATDAHKAQISVEARIDEILAWINQQKGGQKMALLALGALGTVGGIVGGLVGKAVFK